MALLFSILHMCQVVASYRCSCASCCKLQVHLCGEEPYHTFKQSTIRQRVDGKWNVIHHLDKQLALEVCNKYHSMSNIAAMPNVWQRYSQPPPLQGTLHMSEDRNKLVPGPRFSSARQYKSSCQTDKNIKLQWHSALNKLRH